MHVYLRIADRYVLSQILTRIALFTVVALAVLLVERMLRLFDLALRSSNVVSDLGLMVLNLVPHYLGIALPAVFFFAVLLTIHRMSESQELAAIQSAGMGLQEILRVSLYVGLVLTLISAVIVSFVQPHSRYIYRAVAHDLAHQSMIAASREGTFVKGGDYTFRTGKRWIREDGLQDVFLFRETKDGNIIVISAPYGLIRRPPGRGSPSLVLRDGSVVEFRADGAEPRRVRFNQYQWRLDDDENEPFRARGDDERELTLWELINGRGRGEIPASKLDAELHNRLARIVSIMILPFIAIPFGITNRRANQAWGIGASLVLLVAFEKILQLGKTLGAAGTIPIWAGAWPTLIGLACIGAVFFRRAAYTVSAPPLEGLSIWASDGLKNLISLFRPGSR